MNSAFTVASVGHQEVLARRCLYRSGSHDSDTRFGPLALCACVEPQLGHKHELVIDMQQRPSPILFPNSCALKLLQASSWPPNFHLEALAPNSMSKFDRLHRVGRGSHHSHAKLGWLDARMQDSSSQRTTGSISRCACSRGINAAGVWLSLLRLELFKVSRHSVTSVHLNTRNA